MVSDNPRKMTSTRDADSDDDFTSSVSDGATAAAADAPLPEKAEGLLAIPNAQSSLPATDPVRIATAVHMQKCMVGGTMPAPWMLRMVLPPEGALVGQPNSKWTGRESLIMFTRAPCRPHRSSHVFSLALFPLPRPLPSAHQVPQDKAQIQTTATLLEP